MQKLKVYKGITFLFIAELNTEVERTPGGNRFHQLTVTALNSDNNYLRNYKINDRFLTEEVEKAEADAQDFAEGKRVIDPAELAFQGLGFE